MRLSVGAKLMNDIFLLQSTLRHDRGDGAVILTSPHPLRPNVLRTGDWLDHWATTTPDTIFLGERSGAGWRTSTYFETYDRARRLAAALLDLGLRPDKPLMFLSGKGLDHAHLALAAQYVGIPSVAVAEQYSQIAAAHGKLAHVLDVVRPGAVFMDDEARFAPALSSGLLDHVVIISAVGETALPLAQLEQGASVDVGAAKAAVTGDTLAKLLFTSGSTSLPKAVRTTHKMLVSNQTQIAQVWPFLARRPQQIVDWLPWNHTFGGSHNFNLMLANGGTLYIDDGEASEKGIKRTIENIRMVGQTVSFNVPFAYSMMAQAMKSDATFRSKFFEELDLIFYAAASMPQAIWDDLKEHAIAEAGKVPEMSAGWGMTETAPAALMVHGPMKAAGVIGVPLPGVEALLLPIRDKTFELRIKGPNVMDGYHNAPEKTAESFDNDAYLITGDVVRFVDEGDPNQGLLYDGRISEDFKLTTGTWVQTSKVRTAAVSTMGPMVRDLVICGHGQDAISALAFVSKGYLDDLDNVVDDDGVLTHPTLRADLAAGLQRFAAEGGGSSMRITRVLALATEPSFVKGEITQKGNLNQKLLLATRAKWVSRLLDDADDTIVMLTKP